MVSIMSCSDVTREISSNQLSTCGCQFFPIGDHPATPSPHQRHKDAHWNSSIQRSCLNFTATSGKPKASAPALSLNPLSPFRILA